MIKFFQIGTSAPFLQRADGVTQSEVGDQRSERDLDIGSGVGMTKTEDISRRGRKERREKIHTRFNPLGVLCRCEIQFLKLKTRLP
jgi:hypothetical protein